MKFTNKHGIPDVFYNAVLHDKYSKGLADISCTELIDSPRVVRLKSKHHAELEMDLSERIWALLGTAIHGILEHANEGDVVEERLFQSVSGLTLSGAIDVQQDLGSSVGLVDFKLTPTTSVMYGKDSWEKQLNVYSWLVKMAKGRDVSRLQICAILRDWKRNEVIRDKRYPKSPIVMVEVPVWPFEKADAYVKERIEIHKAAMEGDLPECTPYDRWVRGEKWAAMKKGRKKAVQVFNDRQMAEDFCVENNYRLEHRRGDSVRCTGNYCQVREFCDQYKRIEAEGNVIDRFEDFGF